MYGGLTARATSLTFIKVVIALSINQNTPDARGKPARSLKRPEHPKNIKENTK
ncbi:MAG: hypothetical protein MZU91_07950 [Desulfosudis oleivorans]|nr:hypothetical protein [Desulfosudis oleivorans]